MRKRVLPGTATAVAAVVGAVVGAAAVGLATPAYAHVEVSADKAQAGATDVTLTFVGEAESDDAGIRSERIVLPAGIAPGDVRLAKAPSGWKMVVNPDGVTIGGKPLPIGRDATVAIKVAKLPNATRLSFRTIETYGDGKVDRWIEVQQEGAEEPDKPAPLLKLRPAAASTSAPRSVAPTSAVPTGPAPISAAPVVTAPVAEEETDSGAILWLGLGALAVLAAAGAFYLRRRRGGA